MTGSAIAIPLLGATGAHAADGTTWDRVAECESGGSWSANDGNGYYGGLQLTQENWQKYGGLTYAPTADQASRSQQIAVAEKVLDDQGLVAWPTCGPLSGLSKNSGSIDVDTGVAGDSANSSGSSSSSGSSDSSDSSDSSGSSDSGADSSGLSDSSSDTSSDAPSDETRNSTKADTSDTSDGDSSGSGDSQDSDRATTGSTKGDDSDKSGQSGDSSDGTSGTTASDSGSGRHRGDSAEEGAGEEVEGSTGEGAADGAGDGRDDDASGRHASRGSGAARGAADGSYVVRTGDSLWSIADSLDLKGGWSGLYSANEKALGTDPDLILPGQKLELDGAEATR